MKKWFLAVTVVGVAALLAGLGVLIWWLVDGRYEFETIILDGEGFGHSLEYTAAVTRIRGVGDMFWMFYPCTLATPWSRPLVVWLDGVTGVPPSLLANFGMFGPLDFNFNRRNDSWIDNFNLLFVDAPLGTGFSTANSDDALPQNVDENTNHLLLTLESFFDTHPNYKQSPLYLFGQGDGAKLALSTAIQIAQSQVHFSSNLKGVVLGNGVISPSQTVNRLGFYLDEMGYVDPAGRRVIEAEVGRLNQFMTAGEMTEAFETFLGLGELVNRQAAAEAVNLGYILQRLTRDSSEAQDYFGQRRLLRSALQLDLNFEEFMTSRVATAIGLSSPQYDQKRSQALKAVEDTYMQPAVNMVEYILQNTTLNVTIYNGNMDAISNIPGQLDWINNLIWSDLADFKSGNRQPLVVNSLLQGYFRETSRLTFYWMNAAGISVPLDSPAAMRSVLRRCCG